MLKDLELLAETRIFCFAGVVVLMIIPDCETRMGQFGTSGQSFAFVGLAGILAGDIIEGCTEDLGGNGLTI